MNRREEEGRRMASTDLPALVCTSLTIGSSDEPEVSAAFQALQSSIMIDKKQQKKNNKPGEVDAPP
jgi:electron transfer flavoprotein alpha/beta subunit